jgi:hypothetical protein
MRIRRRVIGGKSRETTMLDPDRERFVCSGGCHAIRSPKWASVGPSYRASSFGTRCAARLSIRYAPPHDRQHGRSEPTRPGRTPPRARAPRSTDHVAPPSRLRPPPPPLGRRQPKAQADDAPRVPRTAIPVGRADHLPGEQCRAPIGPKATRWPECWRGSARQRQGAGSQRVQQRGASRRGGGEELCGKVRVPAGHIQGRGVIHTS